MSLFEVDDSEIERLDALQLPKLIRRLVNAEVSKHEIEKCEGCEVNVATNINVGDGGVDGSVKWLGGVAKTKHIVSRDVVFQCKAAKLTPSSAGNEVLAGKGKSLAIKGKVDEALLRGASYVLCVSRGLTDASRDKAISKIRDKFREHRKPYAETADIRIYDKSRLTQWVNEYLQAVVAVKEYNGHPIDEYLQTYEEWGRFSRFDRTKFVSDDSLETIKSSLGGNLSRPGFSMRLVGPSGIGKSRVVYEACQKSDSGYNPAKNLIYVSASEGVGNLASSIRSWHRRGDLRFTLVVDNCDPHLHKLVSEITENTGITLLSIDSNSDQHVCDNTVQMPPASKSVIEGIVELSYPSIGRESLASIVDFADGFPLIAEMVAKDVDQGREDVGTLRDDVIKRKLLGDVGQTCERVIEACSLFDSIGFENEFSDHYKFIAEHIVEIPSEEFYRCVESYKSRRLVDSRGDFRRVIPRPLAVRLSADWWRESSRERALEVIELFNPDVSPVPPRGLVESFCKAVDRLSYLPRASVLTEELCDRGPFGKAEVLLSSWGSRIFRSLVGLNPEAASNALYGVLSGISVEKLKEVVVDDTRRNLVWALERICFVASGFHYGARALALLAASENESWANNATGVFRQLFPPFGGATEVGPKERLQLLDDLRSSKSVELRSVALIGAGGAIEGRGGWHVVGAEKRVFRDDLEAWSPAIWGEVYEYWKDVLDRLVDICLTDEDLSVGAQNVIAGSVRELFLSGRVQELESAMGRIIHRKGAFWPEAYSQVKDIESFDLSGAPEEAVVAFARIKALFDSDSVRDKVRLVVCVPPWDYEPNESGDYVDGAEIAARSLAREMLGDVALFGDVSELLVKGEVRKGFAFGQELVDMGSKSVYSEILEVLFNSLATVDRSEANSSVLSGMMAALRDRDLEDYRASIGKVLSNDALSYFYVDLVSSAKPGKEELDSILSLCKSGRISVSSVRRLSFGGVLGQLKSELVGAFCVGLAGCDEGGGIAIWVSLDVLTMYCYREDEKWRDCVPYFEQLITQLDLGESVPRGALDLHHWVAVVEKLLPVLGEGFAAKVAGKIFSLLPGMKGIPKGDHYLQAALNVLFQGGYGNIVWEFVSDILSRDDPLMEWALGSLLSPRGSPEFFEYMDIDYLIRWAKRNPAFGPEFLAKLVPLFDDVEGDALRVNPFAGRLIDEFGEYGDVLGELTSFYGVKTWWGSELPRLQREIRGYAIFEDHHNSSVREWARRNVKYLQGRIDKEQRREEEKDWDIY